MEECKSLAELTKSRFQCKDISEADMPFKVMSTSYLWCWNEFAQIIYEGTDNSLTYRKQVEQTTSPVITTSMNRY